MGIIALLNKTGWRNFCCVFQLFRRKVECTRAHKFLLYVIVVLRVVTECSDVGGGNRHFDIRGEASTAIYYKYM